MGIDSELRIRKKAGASDLFFADGHLPNLSIGLLHFVILVNLLVNFHFIYRPTSSHRSLRLNFGHSSHIFDASHTEYTLVVIGINEDMYRRV